MAATVARFEARYAEVFGAEAGFREAGIELVDFRITARAPGPKAPIREVQGAATHGEARRGARPVNFVGSKQEGFIETEVYDGERFPTDARLMGPALIELDGTTVVVPPDYSVRRDRLGNFILEHQIDLRSKGRA